ncbi:MAG: protein kinase, partial [Planctomycetota bacterium]
DQRQNAEYSARFKREAKLLAGLQHPHIVSCYQADVTPDGVCFLVMEYVDGPNLREYLVENGPLDVVDALSVCRDLASALGSAHEKKIIHRDVKSENVLLARQPNAPESARFRYRAKLSDLGLARPEAKQLAPGTSLHLTVGAAIMGTPLNMSPEQFDDPRGVDHRTDIYSLGCVLYDMLIASLPFKEKTLSTLVMAKHRAVRGPDPRLERPEIDPEVSELVMSMLAAKREDRPQTYAELIETCAKLIDKQTGGPPPRLQPSSARSPLLLAAVLGAAVVLGGGIWWATRGKGTGKEPLPPTQLALTIQAPEEVGEGEEVVLSAVPAGFASAMPALVWQQVAGPQVDLKQKGMTATFTAPRAVKLYELQFTTRGEDTDGNAVESPAVTVQVAATDEAPTITIEGSKSVQENGTVELHATVVDPDAHGVVQYAWRKTSGRSLQFEANQNPLSFTAPEAAAVYSVEFELTVKAGGAAWQAKRVRVDVSAVNDPPIVKLPTPASAEAGELVTLEAQVTDLDSLDDLKFEWRVESPAGLRLDFSDPNSRTAKFSVPENPKGDYELELALWTTDGTQDPLEQTIKLPVRCEPALEPGKSATWIVPISAERLAGWAASEPPPKLT